MPKFKVLKKFRDIHTKEVYDPEHVLELTEERVEEVVSNLGTSFLSEIEEKPEFPKHLGGGNYELSNGDKVKTKEAAFAAEAELHDPPEEQ